MFLLRSQLFMIETEIIIRRGEHGANPPRMSPKVNCQFNLSLSHAFVFAFDSNWIANQAFDC